MRARPWEHASHGEWLGNLCIKKKACSRNRIFCLQCQAQDPSSKSMAESMISRQWRGLAKADLASSYVEHLRQDTFPKLRQIPGFVDASILMRTVERGVEFLIVTHWTSMEAIQQFTGPDPEVAVVPEKVA